MPSVLRKTTDRSTSHGAGDTAPSTLSIEHLSVTFKTARGDVAAVRDFNIDVPPGSSIAIVGESGSGKSVAMRGALGLHSRRNVETTGTVWLGDTDLTKLGEKELREVRGRRISLVSQDALSSLNPSLTIEYQVGEALRIHHGWNKRQCRNRVIELLDLVGIPDAKNRLGDYPHQFSGGMRQRVLIASALALSPEVLIADEPTTALDVTIQAQVLDLLRTLREDIGMSLLIITHDMGVVAEIAERVAVMYAGSTVEIGSVDQIFMRPSHPYTRGLLNAVPRVSENKARMVPIPGAPPDPHNWPTGCHFHPRCPYARPDCKDLSIELDKVEAGHYSACRYWREIDSNE